MQLSSFKPSSWGGCASQGPLLRLQKKGLVTRLDPVCDLSEVTPSQYSGVPLPRQKNLVLKWYVSKLKTTDCLKMFSW